MSYSSFPPIIDLLPHRPPMILIDHVVHHEVKKTVCGVTIGPHSLFQDQLGRVPNWIGIEYMAQSVAAHAGLLAHAHGVPIRVGFLLGTRRTICYQSRFEQGQALLIQVEPRHGGEPVAIFACTIRDRESGTLCMEGTLNVHETQQVSSSSTGLENTN